MGAAYLQSRASPESGLELALLPLMDLLNHNSSTLVSLGAAAVLCRAVLCCALCLCLTMLAASMCAGTWFVWSSCNMQGDLKASHFSSSLKLVSGPHAFEAGQEVQHILHLPCLVLCALPCPTLPLPCPALPRPALPCPAPPCPAPPCPALPCPALPCLALPCVAPPCHVLPALPCQCPGLPRFALRCPTLPCPALPIPCTAPLNAVSMNLWHCMTCPKITVQSPWIKCHP